MDRVLPTKKPVIERASPGSAGTLIFHSVGAMERGLDGGEDRFADYYFAIYHCSPDEHADINEYREQLRTQFPDMVIPVGRRYILQGEPAWRALAAYYQAVAAAESLSEEFRAYAQERLQAITQVHRQSQSLPVPIHLTEGQRRAIHAWNS
jgi:hypothetical protein